ncbi:MAG: hypothetical protein KAT35_00890, partial [Candidatus Aenigmarchaeota archaeon]|nr:hypothetical protein [Candidatus Aenigmarchaeota archaeon]
MKGIISPIIIVAGLVLIVIAAQLAGVDILGTLAEQAGIGTGRFTVISIYAEDTIVPGTDLSRTYMVATAVANNGAETIIGSIQPYEFKGLSGYGTANIFSIRMTSLKEIAKYRVLNQQMNNIFIIDYVVIGAGTTCSAHLGHPVAWDVRCTAITCIGQGLDTSKRVCAWWRTIAVEAPIRHESTKSEAKVQLTSSTATDTVTISNEQRSGSFKANGELVGTVNWVGGLVSGVQPPSASGYVVYYDKQKNYWKIMESYNKYAREYTGNFAEVKSNMARYHDNEHVDINIAIRDIQNYRNFMFGYTAQDTSISTGFVWDKRYDATGSTTGLLYNMPISS